MPRALRCSTLFPYTTLFRSIPLPLFPDEVRVLLEWLPFAGVVDQPYRVYTGALPPGELGLVLGRQLAWTLALIALGRRSEEHTSELQSQSNLVCRLLLE